MFPHRFLTSRPASGAWLSTLWSRRAPQGPSAADQAEWLFQRLTLALEEGEIIPWFQPQLCCRSGRITGVEALARWQDPDRGLLLPGQFLPLIEAMRMGDRLTRLMLRSALSTLRDWREAGIEIPRVWVNFTGDDLRGLHFPGWIAAELARAGLEPGHLGIELPETLQSQGEGDRLIPNLRKLAAMGCGIDLDDFGLLPVSLTMLQSLPLQRLKIDASLIRDFEESPEKRRLIAGVLAFAGQLGLGVLAEGVERRSEQRLLSAMGCDYIQGYAIARPMPAEAMPAWLKRYQSRRAGEGIPAPVRLRPRSLPSEPAGLRPAQSA